MLRLELLHVTSRRDSSEIVEECISEGRGRVRTLPVCLPGIQLLPGLLAMWTAARGNMTLTLVRVVFSSVPAAFRSVMAAGRSKVALPHFLSSRPRLSRRTAIIALMAFAPSTLAGTVCSDSQR